MSVPSPITELLQASRAAERAGDAPSALRLAQEALTVAQQTGDAEGQALAVTALAGPHIRLGHYAHARALLEQALADLPPDSPTRERVLIALSACAAETNDLEAAEKYCLQAIDLGRQLGLAPAVVRGLNNLAAGVYTPRGEFALAIAADEEALKLAREHNLLELTWSQLTNLVWTGWLTGQRACTLRWLAELRDVALPDTLAEGYWHLIHGELAREDGDAAQARTHFAAVRSIAEAKGLVELDVLVRLALARLCRAENDAPAAFTWAADALKIAERIGYRHIQGRALVEQGCAAWALGHLAEAATDFRAALTVLTPLRAKFDLARATLMLAAVLAAQDAEDAPVVWGEAATRILDGGYTFLVEQERALALPLIAAHLNAADPGLRALAERLLEQLARTPPLPLHISLLGGLTVRQGAREIDKRALRQRRAGELLALLLLTPQRALSFEQVVEALWPEKGAAALPLFHQATSALRRALEPDLPEKFPSRYLYVDAGRIMLFLPEGSQLDVEVFEAHCRRAEWDAALARYGGELLPEYPYADWSALPRQRLSNKYQHVLLVIARDRLADGLFQEALETCDALLALEPWHEEAVHIAMRASLALHNRTRALRFYLTLERTLREELGIAPEPELQKLFHSIK